MATEYILQDRSTSDKWAISIDDGEFKYEITVNTSQPEIIIQDVITYTYWLIFIDNGEFGYESTAVVRDDKVVLKDATSGTYYHLRIGDGEFYYEEFIIDSFPSVPIPDFPIKENTYYDILITKLRGKERTRRRHNSPIRTWILEYHAIHDGDCKYLWDFYTVQLGQLKSFIFIHPETSVLYIARFADPSLRRDEIGENLFDMNITLKEILI